LSVQILHPQVFTVKIGNITSDDAFPLDPILLKWDYLAMSGTKPTPPAPANWDELPDLLLLSETVAITRHALGSAYNLLARGRFPIAHLPGLRGYRFPKARVRAWVEDGVVSNPALARSRKRRAA
jgi:hypothetical protein